MRYLRNTYIYQMCVAIVGSLNDAVCNVPAALSRRQRAWLDFQITSHALFVVSIAYSVYMRFYELALLTTLVVGCSVRYHRNRERVGGIAYMDNAAASVLALYGVCQLFASPSMTILFANSSMAMLSVTTFALSFVSRYKHMYRIIHPIGMHVVPALWCLNVAAFQRPFI